MVHSLRNVVKPIHGPLQIINKLITHAVQKKKYTMCDNLYIKGTIMTNTCVQTYTKAFYF